MKRQRNEESPASLSNLWHYNLKEKDSHPCASEDLLSRCASSGEKNKVTPSNR